MKLLLINYSINKIAYHLFNHKLKNLIKKKLIKFIKIKKKFIFIIIYLNNLHSNIIRQF